MSKRITAVVFAAIITMNVLGASRLEDVEFKDTTITELEELNVSARKGDDEARMSVPVRSIDRRDFLTGGITDIGDALHRMAGVTVRDYGGEGGLKTVSVRGLGAQHTGVLYDGVSLSDVQTGQIDLSRYSLNNLGSLSLLIGDNDDISLPARAAASAANIYLNSQSEQDIDTRHLTLDTSVGIGSFCTINPFFRFEGSNGNNFAYHFNADYLNSLNNYPFRLHNGTLTTHERRQNSLINKGNAQGGIHWRPRQGHQLKFGAYYYENYRQLPGPVIYYASPSNERLKERNFFGQASYKGRLNDVLSLSALAKYNWSTTRYRDTDGKYPGGELDDRYVQQEIYSSATLAYRPIDILRLSYAADFFHNSLKDNRNTPSNPYRNSFLQSVAAQMSLERLKVTARALLTIVNDHNEVNEKLCNRRLSPSVSLSFRLLRNDDLYLRASYKNIFRLPTFNELYFQHYGTINLDPELTNQWNVGMAWSKVSSAILENIGISIDGYYNNITNKIVAMPYNMFLWTMTNLGKVRSTGLDLNFETNIRITNKHHIALSGNYSYQRAVSRTNREYPDWNKQLPYTPINSGGWGAGWINPWINVTVHGNGCSGRYSTTANLTGTRIGGYMEIGFTLYRDFNCRRSTWRVRFDIANAFDRQYEIVRRYPMPGRRFNLTAEWKFKK